MMRNHWKFQNNMSPFHDGDTYISKSIWGCGVGQGSIGETDPGGENPKGLDAASVGGQGWNLRHVYWRDRAGNQNAQHEQLH